MDCFAGSAVAVATPTVWVVDELSVVDEQGTILHEVMIATEQARLAEALIPFMPDLVGLAPGPLSEWLHDGLAGHGLETISMATRHGQAALRASLVETDRRDARDIASRLGLGWFEPVHVEVASARERPCASRRP